MRKDNLFIVGPPVRPEKGMIGYEDILEELIRSVRDADKGMSLLGLHRVGKTSLVQTVCDHFGVNKDEKIIPVYLDLQEVKIFDPANGYSDVLSSIIDELEEQFSEFASIDECPGLERQLERFRSGNPRSNIYRQNFKKVFKEISRQGFRTLLVIDEFDAAEYIFEDKADYELYRNLAGSEFGVTMILVSRRQLYMIEKKNYNNSTFHGSFHPTVLRGFRKPDIQEFYERMKREYGVHIKPQEVERLSYYAGVSPYLYSIMGSEIVKAKLAGGQDPGIDGIYREQAAVIVDYCETVYERLLSDKHIDKLAGIMIGPKLDVTIQDKDLLVSMGYLTLQEDSENGYQAISGYFTDFLQQKAICVETWNNIIEVEKKMKILIRSEMENKFGSPISYEKWKYILTESYKRFKGQAFNDISYQKFITNVKKTHQINATMLDVMSLADAVLVIRYYWSGCFSTYFNNDGYDRWAEPFSQCAKARNPLAHGHEEYLSDMERMQVNGYCQNILKTIVGSCAG